jgi:glutathione-regulated potassium-efflux system ancillary protein KefC
MATVIGSAVIPTIIANAFYLPRHLLKQPDETQPIAQGSFAEMADFNRIQ